MKNLNTFIATFTLLASINLAAKESSKNFNKEGSFAEVCVTDPEGNEVCAGGSINGEAEFEAGNDHITGGIYIGDELPAHVKKRLNNSKKDGISTGAAISGESGSVGHGFEYSAKDADKNDFYRKVCVTDPDGNEVCSEGNGIGETELQAGGIGGGVGIGGGIGVDLPDHMKNRLNDSNKDVAPANATNSEAHGDTRQKMGSLKLEALKECAFPGAWEKAAGYREANGNIVKVVMGKDAMGDKGIYVYTDGDSEHRFYKIDETKRTQEVPVMLSKPQTEPVWVTIETNLTYNDSLIARLSRTSKHKKGLTGGAALTIDPNRNSEFHNSLLDAARTNWSNQYLNLEANPYVATPMFYSRAANCNKLGKDLRDTKLERETEKVVSSKHFSINKDSNKRKLAYKGEEPKPSNASNSRTVSAE